MVWLPSFFLTPPHHLTPLPPEPPPVSSIHLSDSPVQPLQRISFSVSRDFQLTLTVTLRETCRAVCQVEVGKPLQGQLTCVNLEAEPGCCAANFFTKQHLLGNLCSQITAESHLVDIQTPFVGFHGALLTCKGNLHADTEESDSEVSKRTRRVCVEAGRPKLVWWRCEISLKSNEWRSLNRQ